MIGSPNYMFGIYDGDNSGGTAAPGSSRPDRLRSRTCSRASSTAAACRRRTASSPVVPTTARSSPWASPPAGCSPAPRCPKTAAEAALYGGVAGAAYDPCYHSFCDNLRGDGQPVALYDQLREDYELVGNVNTFALDINADAVATAVITFAFDTSTVNGVRAPANRTAPAEAHSPTRTTQPPDPTVRRVRGSTFLARADGMPYAVITSVP